MKQKKWKRVVAVILSITCFAFTNVTAFAEPNTQTEVNVSENDGIRTSVASDGAYEYTVIYDTVNDTMQMATKNLHTGEVQYGPKVSIDETQGVQTRATIHQDTFMYYEYDIYTGSPNRWRLERPKEAFSQYYFEVNETSSNSSRLNAFRDAVDALNSQEIKVIASGGTALVSAAAAAFLSGMASVSGGALTPTAIAAVVAAVGATGNTAVEITEMGNCCNDCLYAYMDVFNNQ